MTDFWRKYNNSLLRWQLLQLSGMLPETLTTPSFLEYAKVQRRLLASLATISPSVPLRNAPLVWITTIRYRDFQRVVCAEENVFFLYLKTLTSVFRWWHWCLDLGPSSLLEPSQPPCHRPWPLSSALPKFSRWETKCGQKIWLDYCS